MMGARPRVAHAPKSPRTTSATHPSTRSSETVGSFRLTYASRWAREKTSGPRETKLTYWSNTFATLAAARCLTECAASSSSDARGREELKLRWYAS